MNQREFALVGEAQRSRLLTEKELMYCRSLDDVAQMMWHQRVVPYTYRTAAPMIGMDVGNFSRQINTGSQWFRSIPQYEDVCGIYGITQYLANYHGKILIDKPR